MKSEREVVIEDDKEEERSETRDEDDSTRLGDVSEETMADRVFQSEQHSISPSKVEGCIDEVIVKEDVVIFKVERLTNDEMITDKMKIPDPWDDNARLARVLDSYGYDSSTIEMMEGEIVQLQNFFYQWRVIDPNRKSAGSRLLKAAWVGCAIFLIPTFLLGYIIGTYIPFIILAIIMSPIILLTIVGTIFYLFIKLL